MRIYLHVSAKLAKHIKRLQTFFNVSIPRNRDCHNEMLPLPVNQRLQKIFAHRHIKKETCFAGFIPFQGKVQLDRFCWRRLSVCRPRRCMDDDSHA